MLAAITAAQSEGWADGLPIFTLCLLTLAAVAWWQFGGSSGPALLLQSDRATLLDLRGRATRHLIRPASAPFRLVPTPNGRAWTLRAAPGQPHLTLTRAAFPDLDVQLARHSVLARCYQLEPAAQPPPSSTTDRLIAGAALLFAVPVGGLLLLGASVKLGFDPFARLANATHLDERHGIGVSASERVLVLYTDVDWSDGFRRIDVLDHPDAPVAYTKSLLGATWYRAEIALPPAACGATLALRVVRGHEAFSKQRWWFHDVEVDLDPTCAVADLRVRGAETPVHRYPSNEAPVHH
jgi:hypothetical protein